MFVEWVTLDETAGPLELHWLDATQTPVPADEAETPATRELPSGFLLSRE